MSELTNITNASDLNLAEFMDRRMRDVMSRLNCMTIGTIVSFDSSKQTAKVAVNFQRILKGVVPVDGAGIAADKVIDYPQLLDVPVIFMNGGGSYLTFPINSGDTCIVLVNDKDMDTWLLNSSVSSPNTTRMHDLADAVALVGIRDYKHSLAGYRTDIASLSDPSGERLTQAGFLQPYAGSSAPSGWLLCYGQSISKTTYPVLFAIIGYTYGGSGDNFNVPDLRGRTIAGLDNMGGSDANVLTTTYNPNRNTLGGATGEEAHQLTIAELAAHRHTIITKGIGGGASYGVSEYGTAPTTGFTDTDACQLTGSNTPHQNVQPTMMINWIIKV